MSNPIKIIIVGNGFGGVYALKNLHKVFHGKKNIELTLIGQKNYFLFTPLLHEVATGGINPENIIEPIRKVLGCCVNDFYLGKAEFVNTTEKKVKVGDVLLPYDYLILAPGAVTNFHDTPGAEQYSLPLKSLEDAIRIKNHAIEQIERAEHITDRVLRQKKLAFVVVGGGATGVELAAELHELIKDTFSRYYPKEVIEDVKIILIQKDAELLPQFGEKVRHKSLKVMLEKGVEVIFGRYATEVTDSDITLDDGRKIFTENVIWVAGIKPSEINFDRPIEKTLDGRIVVDEYLRVRDHKEIFAIGDVAAFKGNEGKFLPALAQVAEKEAKSVAKNIRLIADGKEPKAFRYRHSGDLLSLGRWMAVGEIWGFTFSGRLAWWIWRTVYLSKLISWKKKIKVAADWTVNLFYPRDISEL